MTTRPTGTITFLFTDIEGSTGRWEEQTAEMRAALARHDATLTAAVESHGGWLFKHTGDGILAAFTSPKGAVLAAVEAQRALELPVRMGVATGEAELRGDDYFGPTLNRAARIMSAGHGGQVLLHASTASLVDGIDLHDLGEHRLRDLSRPLRLFQVRAEGLREKFPPLRTLDATAGNLPLQTTAFIGREAELAAVVEAVRTHRLVTLTGVGGVGKTRLALQSAAELVPDFPHGAWLIELAPVGDPASVPDAVANVLGITQHPGKTLSESIADALTPRTRLVLFDNCEHVLDAAADIVELILHRAPDVRVLATSREGLGLSSEHLWPVPSLDVREGPGSEGVALFVDRARAVAPRFALQHEAEAAAVVDICRRLDGIPLAIELAAARMAHLSPVEIRDRLRDRFRLLSGSRRGLERHQTLRNAVQWSYDLLNKAERGLLDRLAVFAGGFDLDAATAVGGAGEMDDYAVLDLLAGLVSKSLLTVDQQGDRTRYGMLETIRQFAEDRLAAAGAADEVRDLHARYYAGKWDWLTTTWDGPGQRKVLDWLESELPNLRVGFRWAKDRDDLESAGAIAVAAGAFGHGFSLFEPATWAEELIEPAKAVNSRWLAALNLIAVMTQWGAGRDASVAAEYGRAGLALAENPFYSRPPYWTHMWAGLGYDAERLRVGCEAEIESSGDPLGLARVILAQAYAMLGDLEPAMIVSREALTVAESRANPVILAQALLAFGQAHGQRDPLESQRVLRRALRVASASGARIAENAALAVLAKHELDAGNQPESLDLISRMIDYTFERGDLFQARTAASGLAAILDRLGRVAPAATLLGFALGSGQFPWHPIAGGSSTGDGLAQSAVVLESLSGARGFAGRIEVILRTDEGLRSAQEGAAMDFPAFVRYAADQIREVRTCQTPE